jgi:RNA-directed DNA polymerase
VFCGLRGSVGTGVGTHFDLRSIEVGGSPTPPCDVPCVKCDLGECLEVTGLFFVRFMDDILVLALTRWKLRRAVRIVNESLAGLGLEKHPQKRFIGRAAKGFDFLGYRLSPEGLAVAQQTRDRFASRAARLQEQERPGRAPPGALGQYVRRWRRRMRAGLDTEPSGPNQAMFSALAFDAHGSPLPAIQGRTT